MPNYQEADRHDFHTCYMIHVSYNCIDSNRLLTWQLSIRYRMFKDVYDIVERYLPFGNANENFPLSTFAQSLLGIDDKVRNDRMRKFDVWLREILSNPIAMTTREILLAIYKLLEVDIRTNSAL
jgi:hypothetical protein